MQSQDFESVMSNRDSLLCS